MFMQAMIFSAGLGSRLYPLTKDIPKALAPFGNETLLSYNLKFLAAQGIKKFFINTHHFAGKIEEYLTKNNFFGLDINISYEKELLDTAGGLAKIKDKITEKQILLFNVDIITNIDINKMLQYHIDNGASATVAVRQRDTSRYLLFDENNTMTGWKNVKTGEQILCNTKNTSQSLAFSGISILNKDILTLLDDKPKKKSLISFFLELCQNQKIRAYSHDDDFWFDCGTIEKLNKAYTFIIEKELKK